MDLDFKMIYSIIELVGNVKETYKEFKHKNKPITLHKGNYRDYIKYDGKNDISIKTKHSYFMLIGFFQELDDEIYVSLNFKNEEYRKMYKKLVKNQALV